MSNFIVPNTFVPGTKAKAQEVNENFVSIQNELNQKAEKAGNSSQPFLVANATEDNHAVNKLQFETSLNEAIENVNNVISCLSTPFVVERGYTNSSGNPAFMTYSTGTLNFRVNNNATSSYGPIIAVPANNQPKFTVTSVNSINMSSYSNGAYNVFLKSNGTAYAYKNTIYTQKAAPASPTNHTIFVNTSVSPLTAKIYSNNAWVDFNDVFLGTVTVSDGAITKIVHNNLNDNGLNVNRKNQSIVITSYTSSTSGYRIYSDGFCEQWGFNSSATARNTSYAISLSKTYANANYNIQLTPKHNGVTGEAKSWGVNNAVAVAANKFYIISNAYGDPTTAGVYWRTTGYLASGQY